MPSLDALARFSGHGHTAARPQLVKLKTWGPFVYSTASYMNKVDT